jgi:hypothetical protein
MYGGVEHDGSGFDRLLQLRQRLDGFVSLDADQASGRILTRPLTFAGKVLELNVCARGLVRVALRDRHGKPLPGFGLDDCEPIQGDAVQFAVTWKGGSDLGRYIGKIVRIEFELHDAKLYAFQFAVKN